VTAILVKTQKANVSASSLHKLSFVLPNNEFEFRRITTLDENRGAGPADGHQSAFKNRASTRPAAPRVSVEARTVMDQPNVPPMQGQPISTKSASQSREPSGRAAPRASSVHFFVFAGQIGSFLLVDLRQPTLSLICTPMLLLALFLKRGSEPLNHSIEEFFH
jgi:hypothetical protein